jgi:hypothetical protein
MENKVRVFDKDNARYGFASVQEFNDDDLAAIKVEFYRNKSSRKGDVPKYELATIQVIKKSNLK